MGFISGHWRQLGCISRTLPVISASNFWTLKSLCLIPVFLKQLSTFNWRIIAFARIVLAFIFESQFLSSSASYSCCWSLRLLCSCSLNTVVSSVWFRQLYLMFRPWVTWYSALNILTRLFLSWSAFWPLGPMGPSPLLAVFFFCLSSNFHQIQVPLVRPTLPSLGNFWNPVLFRETISQWVCS